MDKIVQKCPLQYKEFTQGEGEVELTYDKLVQLHGKLVQSMNQLNATRGYVTYIFFVTLNFFFYFFYFFCFFFLFFYIYLFFIFLYYFVGTLPGNIFG